MEIFFTQGGVDHLLSIKSSFVESGGSMASIRLFGNQRPFILKVLKKITPNKFQLSDGLKSDVFMFNTTASEEKINEGSILIIDEIEISRNNVEIIKYYVIGFAPVINEFHKFDFNLKRKHVETQGGTNDSNELISNKKNKIENKSEQTSLSMKDNKNCVILDNIDCASVQKIEINLESNKIPFQIFQSKPAHNSSNMRDEPVHKDNPVHKDKLERNNLITDQYYDSNLFSVNRLKPDVPTWSCQLKLNQRINLTTFSKGDRKIDMVKFQFCDESNYIEAVAFAQDALKYDKELKVGSWYLIQNARIDKPFSKAYRTWNHVHNSEYDMTLNKHTKIDLLHNHKTKSEIKNETKSELKINENESDDFTYIPGDFIEIKNLVYLRLTSDKKTQPLINTFGIIIEIEDIKLINKSKDSIPLELLNFKILDNSHYYISCSIWGKQATSFTYKLGEIIILNDVQVTNYGGVSLSIVRKTKIHDVTIKMIKKQKHFQKLNFFYMNECKDSRKINKNMSINSLLQKKIKITQIDTNGIYR